MSQHLLSVKDDRTRVGLLATVALAAVALAGCTPGGPSSLPSSSPSATSVVTATSAPASATPSPSPSAAAVDCSADGIVPGRLGCLDTNLPVAGNPGEADATWDADHCSPGDGRFVFTAAPEHVGVGGEGGGEIGRIDVYDPTLTTAEGIHVGSSKAEVVSAYPTTPVVTSFSNTELVVLDSPAGFITIELANGWDSEPWTVANIRIYAADQDPNVPVYGSEDFVGACPFGM